MEVLIQSLLLWSIVYLFIKYDLIPFIMFFVDEHPKNQVFTLWKTK